MLRTIVGKRGRGKTSLAAEIIASEKRDQVFIFDYLGEYQDFHIGNIEVFRTGFSPFMKMLWKRSTEGISTLVVLDEISLYGKFNFQIDHLYRLGRHKGIDVIATSQRFYTLPSMVRSQTEIFHVFQITEERDLQYLRNLIPDHQIRQIQGLRQFQFVDLALS